MSRESDTMAHNAIYTSKTKRFVDVVGAFAILIFAGPVLAVAVIAIIATMGRPAFFVQARTGRDEKRFLLLKLRTMKNANGPDDNRLSDAERLTPVGKFLRKSSIDELPELLNVIRGEMSLVGPRPLLPRYDPWYSDRERTRFAARPGVTGLAQVSGRNTVRWNERLEMDVRYVCDWSLLSDLAILAQTVRCIVSGSDVVVDPSAVLTDLDQERQWHTPTTQS
jgi:lipopolysaccharide/colanic/teichoic acid biosynthesis glycosyltransferase